MTQTKSRGFTIVELLIVIVIIAILAAITIVAYNGITNRAHASAAKQAAQNVVAKAEAYNAETGGYPATLGALTGATSDKSYSLPSGTTFTAMTQSSSPYSLAAPGSGDSDNRIGFEQCTTSGVIVGNKVHYWDYQAGADAVLTAGLTSGTCTKAAS